MSIAGAFILSLYILAGLTVFLVITNKNFWLLLYYGAKHILRKTGDVEKAIKKMEANADILRAKGYTVVLQISKEPERITVKDGKLYNNEQFVGFVPQTAQPVREKPKPVTA
jgi:hypothetical protein